jgi:serine/threonine-protein kinase SRPK3
MLLRILHRVEPRSPLGELRHINRLRLWPLMSVLKEKYLMEPAEAELLSSFLMPMLHYYPDSRATAAEMVKHPWLQGVVVQGELEMAGREAAAGATTAGAGPGAGAGAGGAQGALEEVLRLGPAVNGMVGMGRI